MRPSEDRDNGLQQSGLGEPQGDQDGKSDAPHGCFAALMLLMDARNYARGLGRSIWDFAVEIHEFRALGLTNSELRWLVCNDFVEHGTEVTERSEPVRKFEQSHSLTFSDKSCFVLNAAGLEFLGNGAAPSSEPGRRAACVQTQDSAGHCDTLVPKWDPERRELRLGNTVVKLFKSPAPNQQMILAAFEEEGWPAHIFDPLPQGSDQDPKRRLHDTINSLNRHQKHRLIHFEGDGSGEGVRWNLLRRDSDRGESSNCCP